MTYVGAGAVETSTDLWSGFHLSHGMFARRGDGETTLDDLIERNFVVLLRARAT